MLYPNSKRLIAVCSVLPVLSILAVALRFRARSQLKSGYRADDYLILFALVAAVGGAMMTIYAAVDGGEGEPLLELISQPKKLATFAKIVFVGPLIFAATLSSVKVSTILLYKRIFVRKSFHRACNIMMVIVAGWFLASILGPLFASNPISDSWTRPGFPVINLGALLVSLAATNLALDLAVLCLPLFVIRTLHMSFKRKVMVTGIFWLGLFCVIASIVRLYYFIVFTRTPLGPETAYNSLVVDLIVWSITETCTSIVAACLPTMAPLFRDAGSIMQNMRSKFSQRSSSSRTSPNVTVTTETIVTQESRETKHPWQKLHSDSNQPYSFPQDDGMEMFDKEVLQYPPRTRRTNTRITSDMV